MKILLCEIQCVVCEEKAIKEFDWIRTANEFIRRIYQAWKVLMHVREAYKIKEK